MGSAPNSFSLWAAILASGIGFCFGVLSLIVSQWYQRRLERGVFCDVLLTEILDILERLEEYELDLSEIQPGDELPGLDINADDIKVFSSNTHKIGLLAGRGAPKNIIRFYSHVRWLVRGISSLNGRNVDAEKLAEFRKSVEGTIMVGHWALNASSDKLPKNSDLVLDVSAFWKRRTNSISERAKIDPRLNETNRGRMNNALSNIVDNLLFNSILRDAKNKIHEPAHQVIVLL